MAAAAVERIGHRRVAGEPMQVGTVGGIIVQPAVAEHRHRLGGPHPQAVDGLGIVVHEHLVGRHLGEEEPGVEAAALAERRDPVIDVVEP